MKRFMILIVVTMIFVVSCDPENDAANTADTANSVDSGDSANSADSGNTGNTANSADSGNTGNTGDSADSGNTGDSANSSDTGDTFVECIYNDSNPDPCDNPDNTEFFPREYAGLHWSCPSESLIKWDATQTYCSDKDGRLPTISELRRLVRNCPYTETDGECEITDECSSGEGWEGDCSGCYDQEPAVYSVFCDTEKIYFWSSTLGKYGPRTISFYGAQIMAEQHETSENKVLCVQEK